MKTRTNCCLIASSSGTDANSIMERFAAGSLRNANIKSLVSTHPEVGCLQKAKANGVDGYTFDYEKLGCICFHELLRKHIRKEDIDMIFLVGCIKWIDPKIGADMYNIHPACPEKFGGKEMYGLEVHRRVLMDIEDRIKRGKAQATDRFFTTPTVHEVIVDYDSGQILSQINVEIPKLIIHELVAYGPSYIDKAASCLQKHVLPYEWLMLPAAVEIAAKRIIDRS